MSQFCNICERKVRILKRFLKMGLSGQPGPQVGSIRMDVYLTIIEEAVHGLNTIPYLKVGNFGILTPEHFINPWANSRVRVQELPEHNMKDLRELRNVLVTQMMNLNKQMKEEISIEVERWKQGRLKFSKNKSLGSVVPGDIVMLRRESKLD